MTRLRIAVAGVFVWLAGPARAHSFLPEGGFYDRFVEGTMVIMAYPSALLPLFAFGVLASLWDMDGLPRVWPVFILGQLAGIGLAAVAGPWIVAIGMGVGAVVAILAALLPKHAPREVQIAAGASGMLAVAASLKKHKLFKLPLTIHLKSCLRPI